MDVTLKALNCYWDENRNVINLNHIDMRDNHRYLQILLRSMCMGSQTDSINFNNANVKVASIAQNMHEASMTLGT